MSQYRVKNVTLIGEIAILVFFAPFTFKRLTNKGAFITDETEVLIPL